MSEADRLMQANLESLDRRFRTEDAAWAQSFLESCSDETAARVLESHHIRRPDKESVRIRRAVDYLMHYYSMLELAAQTGMVTDLPVALRDSARQVLSRPAVRRYYVHYYPILPPQLFLARLNGEGIPAAGAGDASTLASFISVSSLREGDDVEMFLWFLDDGSAGGYRLGDVLALLQDGRAFAERMSSSDAQRRTPADRGLIGLMGFLAFSQALRKFLDGVESPLLRSAYWHFHGYWYQQIGGQVQGVIAAAVESLRQYVAEIPAEDTTQAPAYKEAPGQVDVAERIARTHEALDGAVRDLQILTSAIYRYPLDAYVLGSAVPRYSSATEVGS